VYLPPGVESCRPLQTQFTCLSYLLALPQRDPAADVSHFASPVGRLTACLELLPSCDGRHRYSSAACTASNACTWPICLLTFRLRSFMRLLCYFLRYCRFVPGLVTGSWIGYVLDNQISNNGKGKYRHQLRCTQLPMQRLPLTFFWAVKRPERKCNVSSPYNVSQKGHVTFFTWYKSSDVIVDRQK
jgi:hypothetical protein